MKIKLIKTVSTQTCKSCGSKHFRVMLNTIFCLDCHAYVYKDISVPKSKRDINKRGN